MNKPIRVMSVACLLLFMALLLNVTYVQFVQADSLNARNDNKRIINEEFSRDRGPILVDGKPVAESKPVDDRFEFQRTYPYPKIYAPITGFYSYLYSRRGIEDSQNRILSGTDNRLFVNRVVDLLSNKNAKGGSVELTIDPLAQKTAANGLESLGKDAKGAVVALDPSDGSVLAMVTQPSYNPNKLASHNFDKVQKSWERLHDDEDQPMLNRATQQILPPGSAFKMVTAAAVLENLDMDPDDNVKAGSSLSFDGMDYTLTNENNSTCGGEQISFERALEVSCNVSFGWLAEKVGQKDLIEQADKFGFGAEHLDGLETSSSHVLNGTDDLNPPQLAQTGIGQYEVAASPLQMAMVTAGIANDGVVMDPYIVRNVRAPNLSVLEKHSPKELDRALSEGNAAKLKDMMVSVVDQGTGTSAQISGVDVGGKTGTAQSTPERPPYAWFVSFAPADDPQVAIAVVVESSDTDRSEIAGSRLAGPIAKSVMEAILNQ